MRSAEERFRRADLAHAAEHEFAISATFSDVDGSTISARFASEVAVRAFVNLVLHYGIGTRTVRMFLAPRGYAPPAGAPAEFVPSSLYFDVDQDHGTAAAALLVTDRHGASHQWLTVGDLTRGGATLVMDEFNPEVATFPIESFIPTELLADAVVQWAFGDTLPPPALDWRAAAEDEVSWPAGSSY